MHEIEMPVSQPIIVGFEKLKRQNFHESVHFNVEFFTHSPQRAFCTLELNVDIFGWPLSSNKSEVKVKFV